MRKLRAIILFAATLFGVEAFARPQVEVVGLFRDTAVIRTGASNLMLRIGESTPDGMTLVEATPDSAVLEYRGERFTYELSGRAGARFSAPTESAVTIARDRTGQYRTRGMINGQVADLLVDTGASVITISGDEALRLGIRIEDDAPVARVITAQGEAESRVVQLGRVQVGQIELYNVRAIVIDGAYPREILLGMSFLSQVSMSEQSGVMTLTR